MALPVNIESLINGDSVEWERIEFKKSWNPEEVIHTLCAFANDLHNWGGGYVVIGVAENNGQPVLPPSGLKPEQLDANQKEVIELCHKILPNYFPVMQPYILEGQHILVLWCPAGDNRPYTALSTLGKGGQRHPYVRVGSQSIVAKGENLQMLQELAARIPFDDRVNNRSSIKDFDLGLIQAYLQEVKSDLYEESKKISFEDLCHTMLIAKGPNEDLRPVNVGLLFFSTSPEKFFDRAWIELVWHQDYSGKSFKEQYFKGPLQTQLRDILSFFRNNILTEQVIKHPDKAEASRYYNFPYTAIEESLANAVYHKNYGLASPIEVQVFPDKITILSYPGPLPPVNAKVLATQKHVIAREYRNRRIGDFLKELKLTEGRGTGLPTIYNAMGANGSPTPLFETDDHSYFLVTLPIHANDQVSVGVSVQVKYLKFNDLDDIIAYADGASVGASDGANDQVSVILNEAIHSKVEDMLNATVNWVKRADLFLSIGLSNHSSNRERYLDPLIDLGWIEMEYPDSKTHPNQRYKITKVGIKVLELIK
jgi:ATP-dependent DNA helicase RecG